MSLVRWKKDDVATVAVKGGRHPTLATIESLAMPLVQEVVFLADFRCPRCQQRVAAFLSKMNGETDSVVISVLEKKVTLTCTYRDVDKLGRRQLAHRSSWMKLPLIFRLFRSTCT